MVEKDNIEKLILKNLERLNDNDPPEGHFERFEEKMRREKSKSEKFNFAIVWKIAAAAIFIFLLVNQAIIWFSPGYVRQLPEQAGDGISLAKVSPEFEEVEFYFTNAVNVQLDQWNKLVSQGLITADQQRMMNGELEEFEKVFKKLQKDLQSSPNDERVINAMLDYYQTKLNLISMIVSKLLEVKQLNNKDHEPEI